MTLEEYVDSMPWDTPRHMNFIGYNQMAWDFGLPKDQFNKETLLKMV